jgi:hypothetical protein
MDYTLPKLDSGPTTPILMPVFQSPSIKAFGASLPHFGRGASWKITLPSMLDGTMGRTWSLAKEHRLDRGVSANSSNYYHFNFGYFSDQ